MVNLFTAKNKDCAACSMKEQLIEDLMKERKIECRGCASHTETIKYLQNQLEILREEWRSEREEFKRAVDRLIESQGSYPIGQGAPPKGDVSGMTDVEEKALGIFEDTEAK